jgi:hypothetical protein
MTQILSHLFASRTSAPARPTARRFQPQLEALETREVPSSIGSALKKISHVVSSKGLSKLPTTSSLLSLHGQMIVIRR